MPIILTKIIATVGPATDNVDMLVRLIGEGVRVFRINFSHGKFDEFKRLRDLVREAAERSGEAIAILGDLSGPKIRIAEVVETGVELKIGQRVEFQRSPIVGAATGHLEEPVVLSTTFEQIIDDVSPGQRLLIDDGAVRLIVIDKPGVGADQRLVCRVTQGGRISSKKGVNLPDTQIKAPSITQWDWACVDWAIEQELDYLALSFVRQADDVALLKGAIAQKLPRTLAQLPVIAKIEKPQAIDQLEAIVHEADGVMVARGDLGVEMDLARVPVIQKRIIGLCHDHGKPVIVATQMLQSMIEAPTPTRAEASDVANAIFDGADAVMLSGETAVGKYPFQAVHTMADIAIEVESHLRETQRGVHRPPIKLQESRYRTAALAHGVGVVVNDLHARLVVMWSLLGGGARYLSQNRLHTPIVAASANERALRRMALLFGVIPLAMFTPENAEQWVEQVDLLIVQKGLAQSGDGVVVVHSNSFTTPGVTNTLRIHYVSDVCPVDRGWAAPE